MRSLLLMLGLVVMVGFIGAASDGSVTWLNADDGSVPWPIGGSEKGQVSPTMGDVFLCAVICFIGGCDIPGTLLGCECSGGRVCCLYYRCLQSPWWMFWYPCYCGTEMDCFSIPCEPGQPIPMQMPEAVPLD